MAAPTGDLSKARQLKEYRRANGLCFSCGEKFIPGHVCTKPSIAQVHAMDTSMNGTEIFSDEVENQETAMAAMQLSINVLSGSDHPSTIRLRALIGNQAVLILLDSGSSQSWSGYYTFTGLAVSESG
jgi:ribosomal protein L32